MAGKGSFYVRQFVIGLGFLSGLFTAIGIDPEDAIISAAGTSVQEIWPDPRIGSLFLILPAVLLAISVFAAYRRGGITGLVSVIVAYFSGLSLLSSAAFALVLLAVAVGLGYLATSRRLKKRILP